MKTNKILGIILALTANIYAAEPTEYDTLTIHNTTPHAIWAALYLKEDGKRYFFKISKFYPGIKDNIKIAPNGTGKLLRPIESLSRRAKIERVLRFDFVYEDKEMPNQFSQYTSSAYPTDTDIPAGDHAGKEFTVALNAKGKLEAKTGK